jgi:HSP20 family protein
MTRIQLRPLAVRRITEDDLEQPAVPVVDVREDQQVYLIEADLPGVRADSIDLTIERGQLTIRAERARAEESEQTRWLRRERRADRFERSFRLPEEIDEAAITASYRDGVLQLSVPRTQPLLRRIPVAH